MKYWQSLIGLILLSCFTVAACTTNNTMKDIDQYWEKITNAQNADEELDALEALRVYLRDQRVSFDVFGEAGNDSLINLATPPPAYTPQQVTVKFYPDGKKDPIEKRGWTPKNPNNSLYLFNE